MCKYVYNIIHIYIYMYISIYIYIYGAASMLPPRTPPPPPQKKKKTDVPAKKKNKLDDHCTHITNLRGFWHLGEVAKQEVASRHR